ncbi:general secretion pathway protein GspC [Caballeronia sp. LP006]|jgi:general secretion pathway protein C|uniref:type II secretion system protein N n=1 Tax=unclassified Caballeronia TaxID=2646786 RepID=UPI001FCFA455|nr:MULTISPECIES: general secretion pathway protein GspC [unclassified Caballeronia]MDR5772982.1 general secretion pathway protein GspC [Caballeronia sp. LZ002]MDR5803555.1 general secretion pathway protein GspC [Caballeronia sp. LZ001]MDR5829859.1 general secretion pathway protein GspC [Caballeronia sp. LP006]MDR5848416.1 general secretion pathway protein GspC [Caballeronia sp. LZ003]
MNSLQIRLISLAALALFCVTVTYWVVTLTSRQTAPLPAAAATRTPSVEQAATIFGGQLERQANQDVHLFGILALQHGAAAIVSYGGEPARAISLGGPLTQGVKLSEVRARSIIIDRNGSKSEIFLPQMPPGPTIYVR